eukprot:SM000026S08893  [mRNA]  locus=s26:315519:319069:+ [translate_table: standard]
MTLPVAMEVERHWGGGRKRSGNGSRAEAPPMANKRLRADPSGAAAAAAAAAEPAMTLDRLPAEILLRVAARVAHAGDLARLSSTARRFRYLGRRVERLRFLFPPPTLTSAHPPYLPLPSPQPPLPATAAAAKAPLPPLPAQSRPWNGEAADVSISEWVLATECLRTLEVRQPAAVTAASTSSFEAGAASGSAGEDRQLASAVACGYPAAVIVNWLRHTRRTLREFVLENRRPAGLSARTGGPLPGDGCASAATLPLLFAALDGGGLTSLWLSHVAVPHQIPAVSLPALRRLHLEATPGTANALPPATLAALLTVVPGLEELALANVGVSSSDGAAASPGFLALAAPCLRILELRNILAAGLHLAMPALRILDLDNVEPLLELSGSTPALESLRLRGCGQREPADGSHQLDLGLVSLCKLEADFYGGFRCAGRDLLRDSSHGLKALAINTAEWKGGVDALPRGAPALRLLGIGPDLWECLALTPRRPLAAVGAGDESVATWKHLEELRANPCYVRASDSLRVLSELLARAAAAPLRKVTIRQVCSLQLFYDLLDDRRRGDPAFGDAARALVAAAAPGAVVDCREEEQECFSLAALPRCSSTGDEGGDGGSGGRGCGSGSRGATISFLEDTGRVRSLLYLSGMKRDECVAPMPGRPCFTGLSRTPRGSGQSSLAARHHSRQCHCISTTRERARLQQHRGRGRPTASRQTRLVRAAAHLDLDLVEDLAIVDANDAANHLGHNDHVAQVGAHGLRLLARRGHLLLQPEQSPNDVADEGPGRWRHVPQELTVTADWHVGSEALRDGCARGSSASGDSPLCAAS